MGEDYSDKMARGIIDAIFRIIGFLFKAFFKLLSVLIGGAIGLASPREIDPRQELRSQHPLLFWRTDFSRILPYICTDNELGQEICYYCGAY